MRNKKCYYTLGFGDLSAAVTRPRMPCAWDGVQGMQVKTILRAAGLDLQT